MKQVNAHFLIAETAKSIAHELYSQLMQDNTVYAQWKRQCPDLTPKKAEARFVKLMTPKLLETARATLAGMLAHTYDEQLKASIFDALLKDAALGRGRGKQTQHVRTLQ